MLAPVMMALRPSRRTSILDIDFPIPDAYSVREEARRGDNPGDGAETYSTVAESRVSPVRRVKMSDQPRSMPCALIDAAAAGGREVLEAECLALSARVRCYAIHTHLNE